MEAQILLFIQNFVRQDWLTPAVKVITYLGEWGLFWILLCAAFMLIKKTRYSGFVGSTALLLDFISVNLIIKKIVARPRPYVEIEGLINIIEKQSDFSFPSGHSASSFAVAVAFMLTSAKKDELEDNSGKLQRKYAVILIIVATLISLSRLYVGVHYLSDVVGGALWGGVCAIVGKIIVDFIMKKAGKAKEKKPGAKE